ncbi:hypothetical protein BFP72_00420 [Reichenbachiella sp. 5M10]|uniref:substrate-binding domain-containing protein n=1 Tax=Reichenbachiella sp. 5M10 TaxID=1889772 RepID=UPI000C14D0F5|nr:substrate-binding domain-containing protein [Reichenbachiella sp. 5M10]PIB34001.1 hypothetical protein BFP72_00420 [Reichenbachiella sp. 5M10]
MRKLTIIYLMVMLTVNCTQAQDYKVGLLFDQFASARWEIDAGYLQKHFTRLGVETFIKVAHSSYDKQLEQAQELIDSGVDALVIVPVDGAHSKSILDLASKNNVLVIAYDRPILDDRVGLYVSYNNLEVGKKQARALINNVPEGNIILINGPVADVNAIQFRKGQLEVLQPYIDAGKINIVEDIVLDNWSEVDALMRLYEINPDFTEIKGVISAVDWFNNAIVEYLGSDELLKTIYTTGQDPDASVVVKMESGVQNMSIYKPIQSLAKKAAELTLSKLKGEDLKLQTIEMGGSEFHGYLFDPIVLDIDNINDYKNLLK